MTAWDVFNGDADGICALLQLRLERPLDGVLVTGVKRDVRLLGRVRPSPGDRVTVLDISIDSNRADLVRVLEAGAEVAYFDHHYSGDVPSHCALEAHLSASPDVCSSLLVDEFLGGARRLWAVVGAFGDNLDAVARRIAADSVDDEEGLERLRELGRLVNYNGYGRTIEDLHFAPDRLYRMMQPYSNPFDFIAGEDAYPLLKRAHASDMARAAEIGAEFDSRRCAVYVLPDEPWARRVSGSMANRLAVERPGVTVAIVVPNTVDCSMVSVRVPADSSLRADEFCRRFDSGGGRATAAGINHLPAQRLADFIRRFREAFD